jgi:hypothetical protein
MKGALAGLVLILCLSPLAAPLAWVPSSIALYSDPAGVCCELPSQGSFATVYVVAHVNEFDFPGGILAVEFFIDSSQIPEFEFLVFSSGGSVYGSLDPESDDQAIVVGPASYCPTDENVSIGTVLYRITAPIEGVRYLSVVPGHFYSDDVMFARCDEDATIVPVPGGQAVVNGCCNTKGCPPHCWFATPVRESTWGTIKSLYAE